MIDPSGTFASIMLLAARRLTRKVPFKLVCIISSKTSSFNPWNLMFTMVMCYFWMIDFKYCHFILLFYYNMFVSIYKCLDITGNIVVRQAVGNLPALLTTISGVVTQSVSSLYVLWITFIVLATESDIPISVVHEICPFSLLIPILVLPDVLPQLFSSTYG